MRRLIGLLTFLCLAFFSIVITKAQENNKIKYVFLFIGDGMGINQVFLTEKYNELTQAEPLVFMNDAWSFGLMTTDCADSNRITDSGAGGTAIACGQRTTYEAIGMYNGKSLESIAEYLHKLYKFKVGIITSVPINHATPACFYGHQPTRRNYDFLINDMAASGFELFAGGGFQLGNMDTLKNLHKDFASVITGLKKDNFSFIFDVAHIEENKSVKFPVLIIDTALRSLQMKLKNEGSDEHNALPFAIDAPEIFDRLAVYTEMATQLLMNDRGFFIMVEGGKIDWACHRNDALTAVYETNALNAAIKKAYEFYRAHPDNTLILVTADHETGGLSLGAGYQNMGANSYAMFIKKLSEQHQSYIYTPADKLGNFQQQAHMGWTTTEHTAAPVGIWATGMGSHNFTGIIKNSELKARILRLIDK